MSRFDFEHRTCANCMHVQMDVTVEKKAVWQGESRTFIEHGCDEQKPGHTMSFNEDGTCVGSCGSWGCPMKYRSGNADQSRKLGQEIWNAYTRWQKIIREGSGDPLWPDGTNANLVRNHIRYYRSECEALLLPEDYPPEYYKVPVPPEVSNDYTAGRDKIQADPAAEKKPLPMGQLSLFDFGMA